MKQTWHKSVSNLIYIISCAKLQYNMSVWNLHKIGKSTTKLIFHPKWEFDRNVINLWDINTAINIFLYEFHLLMEVNNNECLSFAQVFKKIWRVQKIGLKTIKEWLKMTCALIVFACYLEYIKPFWINNINKIK